MKTTIKTILVSLALLPGMIACTPDDVPTEYLYEESLPGERSLVSLNLNGEDVDGTKASLLEGSEDVCSGATVVVYYADTGLLDSVQEIAPESISWSGTSASAPAVLSLPKGRSVQIYVLGNLWAIDKDSGARLPLSRALTTEFPSSPASLESWLYRLDGSDINELYRFQTLSEVAAYGIPFAGSLPSADYSEGSALNVNCRRLFSKIRLTVDHSGLDGGKNPDFFRNVKLHLRQANSRLQPFGTDPQSALSSEDVIEGDFDPSMSNASRMTFDFYVPENMQGTLLPANDDPGRKDYENIVSVHGADRASLLTYVEFTGEVDSSAGGYGGPVTYRFYLGGDNCSNFDLERHRRYDIELDFLVNSLFSPEWKVNASLNDERELGISADASFARPLPSGQMVAVRKNRPARIYPYVKAGQGGVMRRPDGLRDPSYNPSDLTQCPFTSDFLSETNSLEDVPQRKALSDMGISASYDEYSGCITFSVSDQEKFVPGKEISLSLETVPGGKSVSFTIRTFENMSVSWDKSLTKDFLPGMSRTASISGFSSDLRYRSTTPHSFKYEAVEGSDALIGTSYESNPTVVSNTLKLYNMYYCSAGLCSNSKFYVRPGDDFNDGNNDGVLDDADAFEFTVVNNMPQVEFRGVAHPTQIDLDMAGNEEEIYLTVAYNGGSGLKTMYYSDFDPLAFDLVYKPYIVLSTGATTLTDPEGNVLHKGSQDSHISLRATTRRTAAGWPIYEIFRSRIGDRYSSREKVEYVNYMIFYMPSPFQDGTYHGRWSYYLDIALLPFISEGFDASFASKYDDYTLWNGDYLDSSYKSMIDNSISAPSGKNVHFGLRKPDGLTLYARAVSSTEEDSMPYGKSESIEISQDKPGENLRMSFVEKAYNYHTAGPHKVYACVTNKHSGEKKEEEIGSFDVYVHFIMGLQTDIVSGSYDSYAGSVLVHPQIISDMERTSYGERYNSSPVKVLVTRAASPEYPSPDLDRPSIIFRYDPGLVSNYAEAVEAHPANYGSFQTLIEYTAEAQKDYYGNYYAEALDFMEMCSFEDNHYRFCQLLSSELMLDVMFDNYTSSGIKIFNKTAWDDLMDASGNGYYVFHRLADLRKDSNNWIPLFEHNAGL